jgi:hypothetical protein
MKFVNTVRVTALALATALGASSCGTGTGAGNVQIQGVQGPDVSFVNNTFIMTVVLTQVSLNEGVTIPIPKLPNSYLEVGPDLQSNGMLISLGLSITDLVNLSNGKILLVDPLTLPGGRALPGVVAGYLPGEAIEVPSWDNMVFYMGTNVFGAFIPVKIPIQNYEATFRFFDSTNTQIGNISVVGEDTSGKNSGFLLLIDIAGKVAQLLGQTP